MKNLRTQSYENNIRKLYAIKTFNCFLFAVPVFLSILNHYGLSTRDLFILQASYALAVVCFEIPTGFFGDKYGRKISLFIGALGYILAYSCYILATGFRGFLIGEICIAFAASCISGCDKALLYDSLAQMNKNKDYNKTSGIFSSLANFAESFGAIIAGIVANYRLKLPFMLDLSTIIIAGSIMLSLKEVPIERFDHKEAGWKQMKEIYNYIIHGHSYLGYLLIVGAIMAGTSLSLVWITQPYMQYLGLSLFWIGILWSGLNLCVALFHLIAYRYEQRLGKKRSLYSLIAIRGIAMLLAGFLMNIRGLLSFVIFAFVRAGQRVVTEDLIQSTVVSKMRATIISIQSMLFRLMFVILGPLIGRSSDALGLSQTLYFFAIAITIVTIVFSYTFFQAYDQSHTHQ